MNEEEPVELDAEILSALDERAWQAVLANGHRFTAFFPQGRAASRGELLQPGAHVRVRMSPFDMSRGEIKEIKRILKS